MKIKLYFLSALVILTFQVSAKKKVSNIFYVQNTIDSFVNTPKTAQEKVKLLKSIGCEGLEGAGYADFFELKKALDQEGLLMPVNYVALTFEINHKPENPSIDEIKTMIKASAKGSIIYFNLHSNSYKEDKATGDKVLAVLLRELSDFASSYGVKLSAYPHLNLYCETVAHSIQIAKLVDRKNFGTTINLCHLLKIEGSKGIEAKIKEYVPYLFAVNICGADTGDTQQMDWDQLIQPLGQGTFDTYGFVQLLLDNGYSGPIGLQCYALKGDAKETLTQSMEIWNSYKRKYRNEK